MKKLIGVMIAGTAMLAATQAGAAVRPSVVSVSAPLPLAIGARAGTAKRGRSALAGGGADWIVPALGAGAIGGAIYLALEQGNGHSVSP